MPVWFKLDVHLPSNPKCKRAGYWATQAYTALLAINKMHAFKGEVPADYGAPAELAEWWRMEREVTDAEEKMREGLRACRRENLVRITANAVRIVGWSPEWDRNDSSAERQKRYRARKAEEDAAQAPEIADGDVTLRNGVTQNVTRNVTEGVHRGEERRIEENRGEENPYSPQGDPEPSPVSDPKPKPTRKSKLEQLLAAHGEEAGELWDLQEMLRAQAIPRARTLTADDERLGRICKLLALKSVSRDDCEVVLRTFAARAKADPDQAQWFNGETNWIKKNFDRTLGAVSAATAKPKSGRAKPMPRDEYTEGGKQNLK